MWRWRLFSGGVNLFIRLIDVTKQVIVILNEVKNLAFKTLYFVQGDSENPFRYIAIAVLTRN